MRQKKVFGSVLLVSVLLFLMVGIAGCALQGEFVLDGYSDCEEYFEDGFGDSVDYCKYFYTKEDDALFQNSVDYKEVTDAEISDLIAYFEEYRQTMSKYQDKYDFNVSAVNAGDYYVLEDDYLTEETSIPYSNYTLYYYDIETHTLYHIHSNI